MNPGNEPVDELQDDEREFYEHHNIKVDKGQVMMRIDKFIMIRISHTTRTKIQNSCEAGNVLVNGKPVKSNYRIKPFDEISIVLTVPPRDVEVVPEDIPIDIVYEDEYIALVNKKPGMVVHPGYGNYRGTLVNALAFHFKNLPTSKTKIDQDVSLERPGLVHRIDKNTSGIVIIAKTEIAMTKLERFFRSYYRSEICSAGLGKFKRRRRNNYRKCWARSEEQKSNDCFPRRRTRQARRNTL